jgi:hypothetical protein
VVESTALEMRHTGNRIGGSNPSLSANRRYKLLFLFEFASSRHLCPSVSPSSIHRKRVRGPYPWDLPGRGIQATPPTPRSCPLGRPPVQFRRGPQRRAY